MSIQKEVFPHILKEFTILRTFTRCQESLSNNGNSDDDNTPPQENQTNLCELSIL